MIDVRDAKDSNGVNAAPDLPANSSGFKENLWNRTRRGLALRLGGLVQRIELAVMRSRLQELGAGNANTIQTWTTRLELRALFTLASMCPPGAVALEIGSYLGASSCYLAAGLSLVGGRLICVDTWQNDTIPEGTRDTFAEFEANTAGVRSYITTIRARSDAIPSADLPERLHLVFLDGDHSYQAVHAEVERFGSRIVEGGTLVFHDAIAFEGVARVIGEALAGGQWQFGGHVDNLIWLRRVRWTVPEYTPPSHAEG